MVLVREGKLTKLIYYYEGSQFICSEVLFDYPKKYSNEIIYAQIPMEFLGRKAQYRVGEKEDGRKRIQTLVCKIPRKGTIVINAEKPKDAD